MGEKLKRYVETRYREELRKLSSYWPAEYVTLQELSEGKTTIRLQTGGSHTFSPDEVSKLLETIPTYFHKLMRVPITLRYERIGGVSQYKVLGDQWQRRLVELLLTEKYSYQGKDVLSVNEFIQLLKKYKSLVFVSVTI
ncbi:MAG: DUF61 family protein [Desulfurococcales archaeon]|nr:DUF61 family protein [Desulfurococcales archaeon]MCE4622821.1 DUF61 family protein [Desulfurococcales archaeon]MCE4627053.1 DUF61 family protein [Desulfurococcales archaeon]MCE4629565.1 DUF61 family protein [Desulfurococcales archaeon]NOZ31383.1 DUF61 family protein [Thermoproteota archaeon]